MMMGWLYFTPSVFRFKIYEKFKLFKKNFRLISNFYLESFKMKSTSNGNWLKIRMFNNVYKTLYTLKKNFYLFLMNAVTHLLHSFWKITKWIMHKKNFCCILRSICIVESCTQVVLLLKSFEVKLIFN